MSASERLRRSLAASARDAADAPPPPASVTTLRREIAARGLDDSECVEKADLEAVLRRDDPASLPVRELKRLIELHGGTVPDAIDKSEFARALRETLKCPICLDEIGESDDGCPRPSAAGAAAGLFAARARPARLSRLGGRGTLAAAVPRAREGRAHRQGGARARRRRESKIQHRCPRLKRAADAPTR